MATAPSKFTEYLAKLGNGTLTYQEATSSHLEPAQRQALLIGMATNATTLGGSAPPHTLKTGTQATPPDTSGVSEWSSITIQAVGAVTVNGLDVPAGATFSTSAAGGRSIPTPTITGGDYNWVGYTL